MSGIDKPQYFKDRIFPLAKLITEWLSMNISADAQPTRAGEWDKEALLQHMQPFFPQATQLPSQPEGWDDPTAFAHWDRDQYQSHLLPCWYKLADAYAQALTVPWGADAATLATSIEDWPQTFEAQQKSLFELLHTSKLRMAWRSYCQWTAMQRTYYTDGQRRVQTELEREHAQGSVPMVEIPLYQGWGRVSCQQLICMPVATWDSMYRGESRYEPDLIDRVTVNRLANRVAQVFNTPPLAPIELLKYSPSWPDAVVWSASQRGLTCATNCHGMTDRLEDEFGRPRSASEPMLFPEWRYKGFCGQIRVVLEDGTPWYVTVLAPAHFVRHLMLYANWYARDTAERDVAAQTQPTSR